MDNAFLSPPALLAIYCLLVLLASLAGGWVLLAMHLTHARLQTAVSFVAGLMLGMALLHFIPHAFHQNHSRSDGGGLSGDPGAVVPGAYGAAFAELRGVEGTQGGGGGFEADLSCGHGGRGGAGVAGL